MWAVKTLLVFGCQSLCYTKGLTSYNYPESTGPTVDLKGAFSSTLGNPVILLTGVLLLDIPITRDQLVTCPAESYTLHCSLLAPSIRYSDTLLTFR